MEDMEYPFHGRNYMTPYKTIMPWAYGDLRGWLYSLDNNSEIVQVNGCIAFLITQLLIYMTKQQQSSV